MRSERKERREPEPLPEEAWWTVLSCLRTTLPITPNETTGVADSDFWVEIEDKAGGMKPNVACMEFYVRGIKHRQLAEFVVFSFQTMRSMSGNGKVEKEQKRILVDRAATKLLEFYPPKYRIKYER